MSMSPKLLRPRKTGFDPRSIPGLKVWYDVANLASMTFNGSTVSQINDLSGNGFHATQGTANNQPTYEASGINSRPALSHDSNDTLMSTATISNIVATPSTSPTITLFFVCSSTSPLAGLAVGCDPSASGRLVSYFPFDNEATNAYWDVAGTGSGRLAFSINAANRAAGVYCCQRVGSAMIVRRNGVQLASRSDSSQTFSSFTATFGIGQITFASGFAGRWSQCAVYSAALTGSQISSIERYLASSSGITL